MPDNSTSDPMQASAEDPLSNVGPLPPRIDATRRNLLALFGAASSTALFGCGGARSEAVAAATTSAAPVVVIPLSTPASGVPPEAAPPAPAPAPAPAAPPQIQASVWTPARDAAGNVLLSDLDQLQPYVWYYVGGADAILDNAIETPHYPKPRNAGPDGSEGIVAAWGGAAWDYSSQTMYLSGGGHGDTHECDTGVYALRSSSLRFERVVDRQPLTQFRWYDTVNSTPGNPVFGDDPAFGGWGMNSPLKNGVPTSFHTYDGLVWIPPAVMQVVLGRSNVKGGLFYPGTCRAVINLDDQSYSTPHFLPAADFSYQIAMLDGTMIFGPRASFDFYRFDLAQREVSEWPGGGVLSQGKFLSAPTSITQFVYNNKCFCWMRERREAVSFAGDQKAVRVRYGAAIDSGSLDWTSYHDAITLTSTNGTDHLDFSAANLLDNGGTNLLCQAGAHYDHGGGVIWVQANTVGGALYQITGLGGATWSVRKIAGTAAVETAGQGTFGKFRVATLGSTLLALRVSATRTAVQVMKLA
jgi:hypothetical protein